jgi:hypothetical protein
MPYIGSPENSPEYSKLKICGNSTIVGRVLRFMPTSLQGGMEIEAP